MPAARFPFCTHDCFTTCCALVLNVIGSIARPGMTMFDTRAMSLLRPVQVAAEEFVSSLAVDRMGSIKELDFRPVGQS